MPPLTMTKEEAQSHWMWPMIMVSPQSDGGIKVEITAWTESVAFPAHQVKAYGDKVETQSGRGGAGASPAEHRRAEPWSCATNTGR